MQKLFSWVAIAACLSLAACADIHPLQENVTHVSTAELVKHLRCEADFALQDEVISRLYKSADKLDFYYPSDRPNSPGQITRTFVTKLRDDPSLFERVTEADIPFAFQKAFYRDYVDSAFAMEFTLNASEVNGASMGLDPLGIFSKGSALVGANGSASLSRGNIRNFIISDTFKNLLKQKLKGDVLGFGEEACDRETLKPNFIYPISGSIGIRELIATFIDLNEDFLLNKVSTPGVPGAQASGDSASANGNSKKATKSSSQAEGAVVPVFADTLNFITTLNGSLNATFTLSPTSPLPVTRGLRLANASLAGSVIRVDNHQVIVALSLAPSNCSSLKTANPLFANQPLKSVLSKTSVTSCSAEARAISALQTARNNNFLNSVPVAP